MTRANVMKIQNNRNSIDIYIATHKQIDYEYPDIYKKMQVNCHNTNIHWQDYLHDDDYYDNISKKNSSYCELTSLYSLWKNSRADVKGLVHYRRYFLNNGNAPFSASPLLISHKILEKYILKYDDIITILHNNDIILPMPYRPFPRNAYEDLKLYCYENDIEILKSTIANIYPDYLDDFNRVLHKTNIAYYNMIVANSKIFDDYCSWLFEILFSVEKKVDISNYDTQHKRIFGYFAELLINVYVAHNLLKAKYESVATLYEFENITHYEYIRTLISEMLWNYKGSRRLMKFILPDKYKTNFIKYNKCIKGSLT